MSKPESQREDSEEFKTSYGGTGIPAPTEQAYPNGSYVDLSEEDNRKRTIPRPMIVESCHLIDGLHMYRLKDLKGASHNNGKLYPEGKLGWS
ncbi:hypothetical protein Q7P35_005320 [Cladosporium inversicolor]